MINRHEIEFYRDIKRIANSLESIEKHLDKKVNKNE